MNNSQRRAKRRAEASRMANKNNQEKIKCTEKILNHSKDSIINQTKTVPQSSPEAWFFYRSKYAGCAAFTFAIFLAISQLKPEACKSGYFYQSFDACPLRLGLYTSLFSSIQWFTLHIAATTYDQLAEKSLGYLKKMAFKIIWSAYVVLTIVSSFFSIFFFVAYFSKIAALFFLANFIFGASLIAIHHFKVEKFVRQISNSGQLSDLNLFEKLLRFASRCRSRRGNNC
jgi:hypothetical protein